MDFLTLFLCSTILHRKLYKRRIIVSSLLGSFFAVFQVINSVDAHLSVVLSLIVATIMCVLCYKENRPKMVIVDVLMYYFISATLGGIMSLVYSFFNRALSKVISTYTYEGAYNGARIFIVIGITSVVAMIFGRVLTTKKGETTVNITVKIGEKEFLITGLYDSGNLLTEPFSAKPVILVGEKSPLGAAIEKESDFVKRYIPYEDINGTGVVKGVVPKEIKINNCVVDCIVATVRNKDFNGYEALVPGSLL